MQSGIMQYTRSMQLRVTYLHEDFHEELIADSALFSRLFDQVTGPYYRHPPLAVRCVHVFQRLNLGSGDYACRKQVCSQLNR